MCGAFCDGESQATAAHPQQRKEQQSGGASYSRSRTAKAAAIVPRACCRRASLRSFVQQTLRRRQPLQAGVKRGGLNRH